MKKYLISTLMIASLNSWAGSEYVSVYRDLNRTMKVDNQSGEYNSVCSVKITKVKKGETLKAQTTLFVTNDTGVNVGGTALLLFCDTERDKCFRRFNEEDNHQWDAGNITPAEHHKAYKPYARITAQRDYPLLIVRSTLRLYSSAANGKDIMIDLCSIDVERQTNE